MNLTPTQIADELARKCLHNLNEAIFNGDSAEQIKDIIKQSIPLVELLECAQMLREISKDLGVQSKQDTNLATKLKQLGIEITE